MDKCKNEKCGEIFSFNQKDSHYNKCLFEKVKCNLCNEKEFIRKDFHQHLLNDKDSHIIQLVEKIMYLEKKLDKITRKRNN